MFDTFSVELFALAIAPSLLFVAIGVACFDWQGAITIIPATVFSLGVTLFFILLLIGSTSYFENAGSMITDSLVLLVGLPLLVYVGTLVTLSRRAGIAPLKAILSGLIGLIPLYYLGGFVTIATACSIHSGGC